MRKVLENRVFPDKNRPIAKRDESEDTEDRRRGLEVYIGLLAIFIPISIATLLWSNCPPDSISHAYYRPIAGGIFVCSLAGIGTFLLFYWGETRWQNILATVGGFAAFAVAIIPTSGRGCEQSIWEGRVTLTAEYDKDVPGAYTTNFDASHALETFLSPAFASLPEPLGYSLHYWAAALFLVSLMLLCWSFMRYTPEHELSEEASEAKYQRNVVYFGCGFVMALCLLILLGSKFAFSVPGVERWWASWNGTFVFEAIAMAAFGLAWIVRSRKARRLPLFKRMAEPMAGIGAQAEPARSG